MKRRALLMGVAVMTGLPGAALAKGKGERWVHPYSGAWESGAMASEEAYRPDPADGAVSGNRRAGAILSQIKTLLRGQAYRSGNREGWTEKGWTVELMDPGMGADAEAELRQGKGINLGLTFRYTF